MARDARYRVNSAIMPIARRPAAASGAEANRATVAAGFVAGLLSGLAGRRVAARALLAQAGLPADCLTRPAARVPVAGYAALYNAVVRHLEDEGFGLFAQPVQPGTFEFLCRAAIGSRDLGEALERAGRFLRIAVPDLEVRVERAAPVARVVIAERRRLRRQANDPRRVFAFEWMLRLVHGLACWLSARALPLEEVRFPFKAPAHAPDYALIYTARSRFGGDALVATLQDALLDAPVRRDAADVDRFLEGAPGKIVMLYRRDRDVASAVRDLLARSLASAPDFDAIAAALRLSPRTLHRRLRDEGTSFRAVKAAVRRELAYARLEKTTLRVSDIAAELGYSEPSAFFRAFHGWAGEAPTLHRRRLKSVA
jgi:AraC-like DNA-binding protein